MTGSGLTTGRRRPADTDARCGATGSARAVWEVSSQDHGKQAFRAGFSPGSPRRDLVCVPGSRQSPQAPWSDRVSLVCQRDDGGRGGPWTASGQGWSPEDQGAIRGLALSAPPPPPPASKEGGGAGGRAPANGPGCQQPRPRSETPKRAWAKGHAPDPLTPPGHPSRRPFQEPLGQVSNSSVRWPSEPSTLRRGQAQPLWGPQKRGAAMWDCALSSWGLMLTRGAPGRS